MGFVVEDWENLEVGLELVAGTLSLREVACFAGCCRSWREVVKRSEFLWKRQLERRLSESVYVPSKLKESRRPASETLKDLLIDEKRTALRLEELTGLEWRFRFKRAAGSSWMAVDPYWCDKPATIVKFFDDGKTQRKSLRSDDLAITWRWGDSQSSRPASGTPCDRVRANVDGQDVPTYLVSRHPRHRGFLMQSCWALYTAFPMPRPGEDPLLDDDALEVGFETQAREALAYNRAQIGDSLQGEDDDDYGLLVDDDDDDDE